MDERRHHERSEDYEFPRDRPERKGIQFDWSLNLGHVVTALTGLVAVLFAWSNLKNKVETHDTQISEVKQSVKDVDSKVSRLDDKANESNGLLRELAGIVKSEGAKTRANQNP